MFIAGGDEIKPRGLYRCMTKHIGELRKVAGGFIIGAGKEVAQIMRKNFARLDISENAEGFHLTPDLFARQRRAITGDKDRTALDVICSP